MRKVGRATQVKGTVNNITESTWLSNPIPARNKLQVHGSIIMGVPATIHVGRDLSIKSKPGSWSRGMLDRDSFMIHSVNICLAHSADAMRGTLCMLADLIPPTTLELLIAPINRCSHCDSERCSNLSKITWLIGSRRCHWGAHAVSTKLHCLPLGVSVKWCVPLNSQSKWHVTATTCHLLAAFEATLAESSYSSQPQLPYLWNEALVLD